MPKYNTIDATTNNNHSTRNKYIDHSLSKDDERKLQMMFDESQLQSYFMSAQGSIPFQTLQLAGFLYSQEGTRKVAQQIKFGNLQIPVNGKQIDKEFLKEKITIEEEKAMSLKLKKAEIEQRLKYLEMQTSPKAKIINPQFFQEYKPPNVLSKDQHLAYVQRIAKSREELDKKHKQMVEKLQKSIREQEQKLKEIQLQKATKQKEKKRKQIEKNLQKKKEEHQRFVDLELRSREEYKKVKNKKFLYQKIEAKYQSQVLIPALEQKKKKLKEIREMSRNFDVQELLQHEKQYIQKRNQSFSSVKPKMADDWNYRPPQKKERLMHILEEQKVQQRKKLEEKKRLIEEKIQRQLNFVEYLKGKFEPQVDEKKREEIEQRINNFSKPKRRQVQLDSKTIGISYLEQAKKLKKLTPVRTQTEKQSEMSLQKISEKGKTDYLTNSRKQDSYYQEKRKKRLQNIINSGTPIDEKVKKLKVESQKLQQAYSRKQELAKLKNEDINDQDEALDLLLNGIKAKMGIINAMKTQNQKPMV